MPTARCAQQAEGAVEVPVAQIGKTAAIRLYRRRAAVKIATLRTAFESWLPG